MAEKIILREGYPLAFSARFTGGIGAQYTAAKLEVREKPDSALPLILAADESEITIDHGAGVVAVLIDGTRTQDLQLDSRIKQVAAELRLHDPAHPGDRIGGVFPVYLDPTVIADA